MSAPKIDGITFPDHRHREYPKVLYAGGNLQGATRTVGDMEEELAAREDGYLAYAPEPAAGTPVDADPNHVLQQIDETDQEPADEPVVDADHDGHDDDTGQFVSPQPPRKRGK